MSLLAMHLVLFIFLIPRNYCSKVINEACFFLKFIFVIAVVIALMFVNNKYMKAYVDFSIVVSFFFLLYQAFSLIDFSYKVNERLVREYHRGSNCFGFLLISFSLILLSANIWLLVQHFLNFWIAGKSYIYC